MSYPDAMRPTWGAWRTDHNARKPPQSTPGRISNKEAYATVYRLVARRRCSATADRLGPRCACHLRRPHHAAGRSAPDSGISGAYRTGTCGRAGTGRGHVARKTGTFAADTFWAI